MRASHKRSRVTLAVVAMAAVFTTAVMTGLAVFALQGEPVDSELPPEKAADATPTPTAIPAVRECPQDAVWCALAEDYGARLAANDPNGLTVGARGYPLRCPDEDALEPDDVCFGNSGETVDAYLFGGNHREVLAEDALVSHLEDSLRSHVDVAALQPVSIGCYVTAAGAPTDCSAIIAVAYQSSSDLGPVVLAFRIGPESGEPTLFAVLFESPNQTTTRGGLASLGLPFTLGLEGDIWWTPWDAQ